jgi:Zn-finger nucleic acid-binding protein
VADLMLCPSCRRQLDETRFAFGRFWRCETCGGRAITVELLRRTFTAESINPLWLHAIASEGQMGRPCPQCARQMLKVSFSDPGSMQIDVCRFCHLVWFDRGEVENLTPRPIKPEAAPLPAAPRQAAAIARVRAMAEEARAQDYGKVWKHIGRILDWSSQPMWR